MPKLQLFLIPLVAYLLGAIPFGLLFGKLFGGKDVRQSGSGNIGATNVSRVVGPIAGLLTLLFDAGKGIAAVLIATHISDESATWMTAAALAAVVGHCFPIWLGGRGGKGVATAAGAFGALCPTALLAAAVLFALVLGFWRYVSLASISAAAAMPLLIYVLWAPHHAPPLTVNFGALLAVAIIIYKHDANIQRLVQGEEPKFSLRKNRETEAK
jgi:glycerol-3-phosphate acyltransferase PlsY